jgi:hypothetical protein
MDCGRFTKSRGLGAGLFSSLLCVVVAVLAGAQTAASSGVPRGLGPVYDAAHEVTVEGTIQQVVTQPAVGSPAGWHVMVAGPQGLVDAHLGAFLSEQTKSRLINGAPVQIVGAMLSLNGRDFLLARQLTVGGRTVILRSAHGLPVHERLPGESRPARARKSNDPGQTGSEL